MRYSRLSFVLIVVLALVFICTILVTQLFTNGSTNALAKSNQQAVNVFQVNNRIQQLVNSSFSLQSKLQTVNAQFDTATKAHLIDTINVFGYNGLVLAEEASKFGNPERIKKLSEQINSLFNISTELINSDSAAYRNILSDSIRKMQLGDSIYANCLAIQTQLERSLQQNLNTTSAQANQLSNYNKLVALFAIIAILILTTIIVFRQMEQIRLIDELRIAEATAQKSKNAKEEFLANMSHELRTPLNSLIGFGNLLSQTELQKDQQEYVRIVQSSSYSLLNIVNDILDLSKIEAGKLSFNNVAFNLLELFENLEMLFLQSVKEKNLDYSWNIEPQIPRVLKGDPERLKQVLINLIGNAIKFTVSGGVRIKATVVWFDEGTDKLKLNFSVRDTGPGIPPDKTQSIFERFEQLGSLTQRNHGGTGLGLTIVKELVTKMGGKIALSTREGFGSEFSFTAIFERCENCETAERTTSNPLQNESFEKIKLLLVEDNMSNQALLKHLMIKNKIKNFDFANNGSIALDMLQANEYDLVLMDIQMPVMDGFKTIAAIKNDPDLTMPVIAMTAYVSETEIDKCEKAGFDDYLSKPIDEKALFEKITKFMGDHEGKSGNQAPLDNKAGIAYLMEIIGGDLGAYNEIIREVKSQWETDRNDLEDAISKKGSYDTIRHLLHRIRSTFSPFGPQYETYDQINELGNTLSKDNDTVNKELITIFVAKVSDKLNQV